MRVGLLGLGKMGGGMVLRLVGAGHEVVGMDISAASRLRAEEAGATTVSELHQLVEQLDGPRLIWVMLPAGDLTRNALAALAPLLAPGDIVIDGGNSDFRDVPQHVARFEPLGITFIDVGVSGGQWGWKNGYGLMVGASADAYRTIEPVLKALAAPDGYSRVGAAGAGHLVKAIHNGVQYGVLEAYAEGYALLAAHPEVDTLEALSAWQGGSSVRSWLLEQIVEALRQNPTLEGVDTRVTDSGMGRWTAEEAIRLAVPTPVLSAALHARFESRSDGAAARLLVAARGQIGGQTS